ncbi:MarR family transcriptional regulator [Streptococcus chenjunshii]|uniref:MarR family transcriptional regulator n=1 Tax=Streptococcus chenjunshii TaxID=2173853 RepID=A0A372KL45_9STRE|nr:zinc-dependent MarR family transcriptional regulator [Streptococcus chenjunshii]AXQ77699.1 MarR family transcriptional regulator [Streptococcus chenjunshii]RFU50859.1 MarR family transcriptional regulator [Streptococcus chenjunshii]RFU53005.1 MarR family transcriptional regulator [Streptococcus chenjunshii]
MLSLDRKLDHLIKKVLLKSENQHELLFGPCKSGEKLTNTQEHILMLLAEQQLTNSDLAKKLNISQAAVTKAVKSLAKKGMLVSVKDKEDARVTYFTLTDPAWPVAEEHRRHHHRTLAVYQELLAAFTEEEQAIIQRFLTVFEERLER